MNDFEEIEQYVLDHIMPEESFLWELDRETHFQSLYSHMLSGHLQGKILYMLCRMINPTSILEIGTFTGYSAICMAMAMAEGGMLHTIEINDELESTVSKFINKAGLNEKVVTHFGDALEIIPQIDTMFDVVFIDANKRDYITYYNAVFDKVRSGGFIMADNILWNGKVVDKPRQSDAKTKGIIDFNEMIKADKRVENVILPIRDGVSIIRKI